jgi:ethanolamine phosphate transferase 2 subunit G
MSRLKFLNTAVRNVLHESLTLCLMTQSRTTNIPLFVIFRAQKSILAAMSLSGVETSITSILSQYMAFFCFGGSNSISSLDLSAGYNGVGSYNALLVGVLTFLGNWAGPIWWVSATHLLLSRWSSETGECHIALLTFHSAVSLFSVMAACTVLRTHLFIWTVFSPKFLYSIAWATANHFFVNVLAQGLSWLV